MALTRKALRVGAKTFRIELRRRDAVQCGSHGSGRQIVEQNSRLTSDDRLECPSARQRNDGTAARLRFHRHDAEVLLAGQKNRECASILFANLLVAQVADKLDGAIAELLEALTVRTVTGDPEPGADATAGLDGYIDSLIWNQGGHDQKMPSGRCAIGVVEDRVDRWIHDCRLAIVVSADPPRNVSGVRDKAPHA